MSVRRQNMNDAFIEHPLGPVARGSAEGARKGARRDLHPASGMGEALDHLIMGLDPGQALRVSEHGRIARRRQIEEELLQALRNYVMGRLNQRVTRVRKREKTAGAKPCNKVGGDVIVGARDQAQGHAFVVENALQLLRGFPDLGARVWI